MRRKYQVLGKDKRFNSVIHLDRVVYVNILEKNIIHRLCTGHKLFANESLSVSGLIEGRHGALQSVVERVATVGVS